MRVINLIVVHCSATKADRDFTEQDLEVCHRRRGVFLWVLTEEEGLAAIGFLIFCMGLGQVLIAYTTTPHKKKKDDPFPPTRINQDENGVRSMKIENIELGRNKEAKETQNIKNNIDTPYNEE